MRSSGIIVSALLSVSLSACAVVDPYISPPSFDASSGGAAAVAPSSDPYQSAEAAARNVAADLHSNLEQIEHFDFWTGLGLGAAGIAVIGLGAYGAHPDKIIGIGLGASALLGARAYVPLSERKAIYSQGAAAIECAITTTSIDVTESTGGSVGSGNQAESGVAAQVASLASAVKSGQEDRGEQLMSLTGRLGGTQGVLASAGSLAAVQAAQLSAAERRTQVALEVAAGSGPTRAQRVERLKAAVGAIVVAVNDQLRRNALDYQAALAAANTGIADLIKQQKDAVEAALEAAGKQKDQADATKTTAEATATVAKVQQDTTTAADAGDLAIEAEASKDEAEAIEKQLQVILNRIKVPRECFGSLIVS